MKRLLLLLFLCLPTLKILAQDQTTQSDTLRKDALNVYMQANDYIRQEIVFVNFVRDRQDADVYIISTSQRTGSGGNEYTYFISGQKAFAGMSDTITYMTGPDDTSDISREKSVKALKMGLIRYVLRTPLAEYMNIGFTQKMSETVTTDKWDSWVFRTQANGSIRGEKSRTTNSFSGNFSANRVTKEWKISIRGNYSNNISKIETGSGIVTSIRSSKSSNALIVKSISDHWSVGGSTSIGESSFDNQIIYFTFMPGIEYDIFPYSQSTRRQFRVLYRIGMNSNKYVDTTLFNKTQETLGRHSLTAAYEIIEKWGTIDVSAIYSNYLHDWSKNNLSFDGSLNMRVAKGLSFSFSGGISLIHDQLSLPKRGASEQEILLQTKRLATQYDYSTSFGVTYTFGSIYNNVVNPRFGN